MWLCPLLPSFSQGLYSVMVAVTLIHPDLKELPSYRWNAQSGDGSGFESSPW